MGLKAWPTWTEERTRQFCAALSWLRVCAIGLADNDFAQALFSGLGCPFLLLRGPAGLCISLGHAKWCMLTWPAHPIVSSRSTETYFVLSRGGEVSLSHIVDPTAWKVIPYQVHNCSEGLLFSPKR